MTFTVEGASRETGKTVSVIVDVETEDDARNKANQLGVMVSSVKWDAPGPDPRQPESYVPRRYRALGTVALIFKFLGWFEMVISAGAIVAAMVMMLGSDPLPVATLLIVITGAVVGTFKGLLMYAFAQAIYLAIDIEHNQRIQIATP